MISFMLQRREELRQWRAGGFFRMARTLNFPLPPATACPTNGEGSRGNTSHLYLGHRPLAPKPYSPKARWDK